MTGEGSGPTAGGLFTEDITTLAVDAIVNAANETVLGGVDSGDIPPPA